MKYTLSTSTNKQQPRQCVEKTRASISNVLAIHREPNHTSRRLQEEQEEEDADNTTKKNKTIQHCPAERCNKKQKKTTTACSLNKLF